MPLSLPVILMIIIDLAVVDHGEILTHGAVPSYTKSPLLDVVVFPALSCTRMYREMSMFGVYPV